MRHHRSHHRPSSSNLPSYPLRSTRKVCLDGSVEWVDSYDIASRSGCYGMASQQVPHQYPLRIIRLDGRVEQLPPQAAYSHGERSSSSNSMTSQQVPHHYPSRIIRHDGRAEQLPPQAAYSHAMRSSSSIGMTSQQVPHHYPSRIIRHDGRVEELPPHAGYSHAMRSSSSNDVAYQQVPHQYPSRIVRHGSVERLPPQADYSHAVRRSSSNDVASQQPQQYPSRIVRHDGSVEQLPQAGCHYGAWHYSRPTLPIETSHGATATSPNNSSRLVDPTHMSSTPRLVNSPCVPSALPHDSSQNANPTNSPRLMSSSKMRKLIKLDGSLEWVHPESMRHPPSSGDARRAGNHPPDAALPPSGVKIPSAQGGEPAPRRAKVKLIRLDGGEEWIDPEELLSSQHPRQVGLDSSLVSQGDAAQKVSQQDGDGKRAAGEVVKYADRVVEVPKVVEVIKYVDRVVELPKEVEVIKEVVKEVPIEVWKEVEVIKYVDRVVERPKEGEANDRVEQRVVEVPEEVKVQERSPVEKWNEVIVEVPKEVIIEVPKEVIHYIDREVIVEVPKEVLREVVREVPTEVIREVPREVPIEVIKEVPVEVVREVEVINNWRESSQEENSAGGNSPVRVAGGFKVFDETSSYVREDLHRGSWQASSRHRLNRKHSGLSSSELTRVEGFPRGKTPRKVSRKLFDRK